MEEVVLKPVFYIGQIIYCRYDPEQRPKMVVAYHYDNSSLDYVCADEENMEKLYKEFEISDEKNVIMSTSN